MACHQGHLECVKVLSSRGASRAVTGGRTAESTAEDFDHPELLAWLIRSRDWTPLHHTDVITSTHARALLRAGASLHTGSPTPLELAAHGTGDVHALLRSASTWSLNSHDLFPADLRARAVALLRIGYLLAWSPRFQTQSASLVDAWRDCVIPHAMAHL